MPEVSVSGSLRAAMNGATSVTIEADTIRELLRKIGERYPQMQSQIDAGIAVSINGEIFRDNRDEDIPAHAEVFLLPRIQGG